MNEEPDKAMSDTPETNKVWHATIDWCNRRDITQDPQHVALANLAEKLERERDEARRLYETECKDMAFLQKTLRNVINEREEMRRERDEARAALAACKEDSIELLGEREWWKDEPRCGYSKRYEETAENIRRASELLSRHATPP